MQNRSRNLAVVTDPHTGEAELGESAHEGEPMAKAEQPAEISPEQEPVLITRYPNRRLYNRSQARYVTLPEIAELVRNGRTVAVRDSKTGDDLTRSILSQIILEQYPERMELFPVSILHAIIRANETALGFLREYVHQSLSYLDLLQRPAAVNPLLLPLQWMRSFVPNPTLSPATPVAESDTAALLRRIGELERRLDEAQIGGGKSGPTTPSKDKTRGKSSERS
jgi:polyhydroxyalkanoate synthesis repressor PhaR